MKPTSELLRVCHADGTELSLENGEDIWDPILDESSQTLTGSVMIPRDGAKSARWPDDASSRRTFLFHFRKDCWIRDREPLVGLT